MNWPPILLSILGSLCVQLLSLAELRNLPVSKHPDLKSLIYWLPFMVYPFVAGVMGYAYFYNKTDVAPLLAIQIGASAPLLWKQFSNTIYKNTTE